MRATRARQTAYGYLVLSLAVSGCALTGPTERYGFVAVLGRDTVSVERITRTQRKLVSDGVDRFPFVRQRHTVLDLAPDGKITRMVMDVRTPNGATPAERGRRVTAKFTRDSVFVSIKDSAGVKGRNFATGGAITVPHVSMMYSVIELEIATALAQAKARNLHAGDSVPFRQFYPDRNVGQSFVLHTGRVIPRDGGKVELRHDWLSGTGDVVVDSSGRMLSYNGMRSTYKVEVRRITDLPDIDAIGARFAADEKRTGQSQLSVRDTTRATIGAAQFTIDYGRPLARGRVLLGNVIEYDVVWRTGANAATQFTTTAPITLAGLTVPAGSYTLWTAPHHDGADIIVNSETGQWGTGHDRTRDLGRAPTRTETLDQPIEKFTIRIEPHDARTGSLVLEWGTFRWTAPIVVKSGA